MHYDFGVFQALMLALVGGTLLAAWYFSQDQKTLRTLKSLRPTRVRDAPEGARVKVVGDIEALSAVPPLTSPLTGRACVYYKVVIQEKSGKNWVTRLTDEQKQDFTLHDGEARALVRMDLVHAVAEQDSDQSSGFLHEPTASLLDYLAAHGLPAETWLGTNRSYRFKEGVFAVGEYIAALGAARWEVDPEPVTAGIGYREPPKRLVIVAPDDGRVLLSDDPSTLD